MAASAKERERIRKLIALSSSPEPNEAARAREEAERLMTRHGLTLADFEDDVVEVADEQRDAERQRLAYAVAVSRRCALIVNKRNQIAFRGGAQAAANARNVYQALVSDVNGTSDIGPNAPAREVWRICFWMGFVDAIIGRLIDNEVPDWQPPAPVNKVDVEPVPKTETQLEIATQRFAAFYDNPHYAAMGIHSTRQDAYRAGLARGQGVHIEPFERRGAPGRTLGEKQS